MARVVKNSLANAGDIRETWVQLGSKKIPWRRAWQPPDYFYLENPEDREAWRAEVQVWLEWLSRAQHTLSPSISKWGHRGTVRWVITQYPPAASTPEPGPAIIMALLRLCLTGTAGYVFMTTASPSPGFFLIDASRESKIYYTNEEETHMLFFPFVLPKLTA